MDAPHCPPIHTEIQKVLAIKIDVEKKAILRASHEGIDKDDRVVKKGHDFYGDLKGWAMFKLAYYQCFKCKKPYFGGMKDCIQAQQAAVEFKATDLVCASCVPPNIGGGISNCKTHGTEYIEYKCKFCCSIAQWFCWGNTHFCD